MNKSALVLNDMPIHYSDVIMSTMVSQITSLASVYLTVHSGRDQRKHQSYSSLAFVRIIHRRPVNSPHKWSVTRKVFPFHDVIMKYLVEYTIWKRKRDWTFWPLELIFGHCYRTAWPRILRRSSATSYKITVSFHVIKYIFGTIFTNYIHSKLGLLALQSKIHDSRMTKFFPDKYEKYYQCISHCMHFFATWTIKKYQLLRHKTIPPFIEDFIKLLTYNHKINVIFITLSHFDTKWWLRICHSVYIR